MNDAHLELARKLAGRFAQLPQVEAVALTGSINMGVSDADSDIDLYIYSGEDIPVADRKAVAAPYTDGAEFDNRYWGTADTWRDLASGVRVEAIFWSTSWIEGEIERVLRRYEATTGYSTAFWHSFRSGRILFDRQNWLHALQAEAQQPYPEALRSAIIAKNYPTLRLIESCYLQQITLALKRGDVVSLNHRVAALLASYFDILFALNRQPHPGEKRLLRYAEMLCEKRPPLLREQVTRLIQSTTDASVVDHVNVLIDGLDALLVAEGIDPARL